MIEIALNSLLSFVVQENKNCSWHQYLAKVGYGGVCKSRSELIYIENL